MSYFLLSTTNNTLINNKMWSNECLDLTNWITIALPSPSREESAGMSRRGSMLLDVAPLMRPVGNVRQREDCLSILKFTGSQTSLKPAGHSRSSPGLCLDLILSPVYPFSDALAPHWSISSKVASLKGRLTSYWLTHTQHCHTSVYSSLLQLLQSSLAHQNIVMAEINIFCITICQWT